MVSQRVGVTNLSSKELGLVLMKIFHPTINFQKKKIQSGLKSILKSYSYFLFLNIFTRFFFNLITSKLCLCILLHIWLRKKKKHYSFFQLSGAPLYAGTMEILSLYTFFNRSQDSRNIILWFDWFKVDLGPEYVQNIFSHSLKKKLPIEKTKTN